MKVHPVSSLTVAAALAVGAFASSAASADSVVRRIDENRVLVVDYRGRPPFKRQVVELDALSSTELARFELMARPAEVDSARIGETITVVDFRGKPPYKRQVIEIDAANVAQFARFEEVTEEVRERPLRPRFPGKQFPLRR
jgi:hypothetical protein